MSSGDGATGAIPVDDLRAFCVEALEKVGVGEADARTTADVLVTTDSWGVFTHGVKALKGYVRRIQAGRHPGRRPAEDHRGGAGLGDRRRRLRAGHGHLDIRDAGGDRQGAGLRDRVCGRVQ